MTIKILYTSGNIQHIVVKNITMTENSFVINPKVGATKFIDKSEILELDVVEDKDIKDSVLNA